VTSGQGILLVEDNDDDERTFMAFREANVLYANRANSYVQKPVDHDRFVTAARQLGLSWTLLNLPAPTRVR
jgi:hypothetical protein